MRSRIQRRLSPFCTILFFSFLLSGCGGEERSNLYSTFFGNDGKIIKNLTPRRDAANGIIVQPDGKIIVVGETFNGSDTDFLVLRYNSDGTLDQTFGVEGRVVTDFAHSDDGAIAVAIDSAGRIIVAGYAYVIGSAYDAVLVFYDSSGNLDLSFNSSGKGLVSFSVYDDFPAGLAIRSDGKILVAGSAFNGFNFDFAVAVSRDSGPSFASGFRKGVTPIGTDDDFAFSMNLLPDDEFILAGDSFNGSDFDFALARYSNTGELISTFGTEGKVVSSIGVSHESIRAMAIQNGKIVLAGFVYNATDPDVALARYNLSDGSIDTTFDGDGILINPIGTGEDLALSISILSDNRILIAGETFNGVDGDFLLARYDPDGIPDSTFGNAGVTTTDFKGGEDTPHALAIQMDGKILVAGESRLGGNKDVALARYDQNGTLDPFFKTEGK